MNWRLGHRPSLDGIRAVAIIGVMGLHAIARLVPGGASGVDVFFVLSSFLISTLILEELRESGGRLSFVSFYVRRALRLGPALVLWLAVIAAPTALAGHQGSTILLSTTASLLYFGDFAISARAHIGDAYTHVWSLAIEEQFYALWPAALVGLYLSRRRIRVGAMVWGGGAAALAVLFGANRLLGSNYFLPTGHAAAIAAGALAAYLFARQRTREIARLWLGDVAATLSLAIIIGAFVAREPGSAWWPSLNQVAVSAATVALILHVCCAPRLGLTNRVLSSAPAVWLGRRSYGLYLYHRTLAILIPLVWTGVALRYAGPLVLLLSFAIAEVSFRLVERPVNRWGRRRLRDRHYAGVREAEFAIPVST